MFMVSSFYVPSGDHLESCPIPFSSRLWFSVFVYMYAYICYVTRPPIPPPPTPTYQEGGASGSGLQVPAEPASQGSTANDPAQPLQEQQQEELQQDLTMGTSI